MGLTKLGLYIEQSDFRNADSLYGADSVVGLSTQKQISPLKFHHLPRGVVGCY